MEKVFNEQVIFNSGTQTYGGANISGDLEVDGTIRARFVDLPAGEAFSLDKTLRSGNTSGIGLSVGISTFISINSTGISAGVSTFTSINSTGITATGISAGVSTFISINSTGITATGISAGVSTFTSINSTGITAGVATITTSFITNLQGVGAGTSVKVPTNNKLVGVDIGSIYAPGMIVQTVYLRTDTRTNYASNNSGDGTTISALQMTIVPKNANNRIICQWMINGEVHQDNVLLIHRDGTLITTAGEEGRNSISNSRWIGYASAFYDQNEDSTPSNWVIMYSQIAGSTSSRTYAPATRSSSSGTYTFYLNRTQSSSDAGQDAYERMVSTGVIFEVAV